jgi:hypothetical protein
MRHFAKVEDSIVTNVIVAEPEFFKTFVDTSPGEWIQTCEHTQANEHKQGGDPVRGNFAAKGYIYDKEKDAFYPPQPYASWALNEDTFSWEPPVPYPTDSNSYTWNEQTKSWKVI